MSTTPKPPSFASPASHPVRRVHAWGYLLAGLVLTVYFHTPVREVLTPDLDPSNYASYAYFIANGFQYGPEVVPMAGPYGFVLYGWTYGGDFFWTRTVVELLLNGSLATLTLWFFFRHRSSRIRWVWLAFQVAYTPFIEDLPIEWLLLLGGLFLIDSGPRPQRPSLTIVVTALLALVSLIKGTQIMLGFATIAVVITSLLFQRRPRQAILITISYLTSFGLFWVLAGQNLLNIPSYLRAVANLASGYNDAMSLDESLPMLLRGLAVTLGLIVALGVSGWHRWRDSTTSGGLLLLAGHSFVQWKHGFVRADGHMFIYLHYAMVAACTLPLVAWRSDGVGRISPGILNRVALVIAALTIAAASSGTSEPMLPSFLEQPGRIVQRFGARWHYLGRLPEAKSALDDQLAAQSKLHSMPLTRHEVGMHSIDHFGFEHGLIPLNHLNYRPRPMGGGAFNAYTPALMEANRAFLRDPARRPDYYLFRIQTIDDRFAAQDDGLALVDLLQRYEPVRVEHDHILLQARPDPRPAEPRLVERRTFQIGDEVSVPAVGPDEILLARFNLELSLLGRIRNFFYKLPLIQIAVHGNGIDDSRRHRLIPAMARSPFLFSPFIERNRDWIGLFTSEQGRTIDSFRISTRDRTWFRRTVTAEFLAQKRPQPSDPAVIAELIPFTQTSVESIESIQAGTGTPLEVIGQLVHPPSELTWRLDGTERTMSFGYGFAPAAYAVAFTDGAEFFAQFIRPGQAPIELFRRMLDPVRRPGDRGHHLATVPLPPSLGAGQLVLGTAPGPAGNTGWDWTYFSGLDFIRNDFQSSQFPGFSSLPTDVDAPLASVITHEGQPLLMLHAPSALTFTPDVTVQNLELEFGLLPGAYTGEGRTPGIDYVVNLIRAGTSPHEVYRRSLRPLDNPADRGQQHVVIELPHLQPGDRLRIETRAGPSGRVDWGWAYISRLSLR